MTMASSGKRRSTMPSFFKSKKRRMANKTSAKARTRTSDYLFDAEVVSNTGRPVGIPRGRFFTNQQTMEGVVVKVRAIPREVALVAATPIRGVDTWQYSTIPSNPDILSQLNGYDLIYDQVRILNYKATVWLKFPTEYVTATYEQPRMRWAYDPDSEGRSTTFQEINYLPNMKENHMLYGKTYTYSFTPSFTVGGTNLDMYNTPQGYVDTANLGSNARVSGNGILYAYSGGPNTIVQQTEITLHYRHRKQGALYSVAP